MLCVQNSAVSHIPQFGDANTSLSGDAGSPAGDVDVSAGGCASLKEMTHLQWETTASPAGDLLASPNFGICNTTQEKICRKF
jgi:hypothetical protein